MSPNPPRLTPHSPSPTLNSLFFIFSETFVMAILVFEHDRHETSARLGQMMRDTGHRLDVRQPYAGDALPTDLDGIEGLIIMGGPQNVDQQDQYPYLTREMQLIKTAHEQAIPVVGICLGAQLIAAALGGEVGTMPASEIGWRPIDLTFPGTIDSICAGLPWKTVQFHSHDCEITKLPPDGVPLASSQLCRTQAFKVGLRTYGFQFHFEWTRNDLETILQNQLAPQGTQIEPICQQCDDYYDLYRHLGDRLANNLALLLFPLDKRLTHKIGPVENFHAS